MGVVASVLAEPPVPLVERAPGIPSDLLTIVAKAMARRPEDRYATAGELARDLRRFQSGQLVGAHRYSTTQLVRRWLHTHRTAVSVAALAVVALAIGGIVSVRRIVLEQRASEVARKLADKNRALAEAISSAAEGLTTFMLTNLRDQLVPIGKQDLIGVVAQRVHDYYQHQPEAHGAAAQHGRSQALRNLVDVLLAQGNTAGALADYRGDIAILFGMLASRPHDTTILRDIAVADVKIAQVVAMQGDTAARARVGAKRSGKPRTTCRCWRPVDHARSIERARYRGAAAGDAGGRDSDRRVSREPACCRAGGGARAWKLDGAARRLDQSQQGR